MTTLWVLSLSSSMPQLKLFHHSDAVFVHAPPPPTGASIRRPRRQLSSRRAFLFRASFSLYHHVGNLLAPVLPCSWGGNPKHRSYAGSSRLGEGETRDEKKNTIFRLGVPVRDADRCKRPCIRKKKKGEVGFRSSRYVAIGLSLESLSRPRRPRRLCNGRRNSTLRGPVSRGGWHRPSPKRGKQSICGGAEEQICTYIRTRSTGADRRGADQH